MLQLHIWGPAFGFASFDPECLAAVAYCKVALPKGEWVLFGSCDEGVGPAGESLRASFDGMLWDARADGLEGVGRLPALYDEEKDVWVAGFGALVRYLRELDPEWDLDGFLAPQQRADATAFTSHIHLHLAPLVQLLLYCTPKNYAHTRHAISTLLPFPLPYFIPPRLHARAREQTAHLNLAISSSLDDDDHKSEATAHTAADPTVRIPPQRQTLSGMLFATAATDKIRLSSYLHHALSPLLDLLQAPSTSQQLPFLFNPPPSYSPPQVPARPSTLDTLLFAHLALLFTPDLPDAWGRVLLAEPRWDVLRTYSTRLRSTCGMFRPVTQAMALDPQTGTSPSPLPWRRYQGTTPAAVARRVAREAAGALPFADSFKHHGSGGMSSAGSSLPPLFPAATAAAVMAGVVGVVGYVSYSNKFLQGAGTSGAGNGERKGGLGGMGEAGEMLGSLAVEMEPVGEEVRLGSV